MYTIYNCSDQLEQHSGMICLKVKVMNNDNIVTLMRLEQTTYSLKTYT